MVKFGAGPELAAQCPQMAPPDGYRAWIEADGPIPDELAKRAAVLGADVTLPLGAFESYPIPGITTLMRVEPHVWGRDDKGNLVQGCFRAVGIYVPALVAAGAGLNVPSSSRLETTIQVLTAASLVIGIGAAVWRWKKGKAA